MEETEMKQKNSFIMFLCFGLMLLLAGSVAHAQSITVTSPAAGATWHIGSGYTITWTKSGSMDANVKIRLQDSGSTMNVAVIADNVPNNGSFGAWTVPGTVAPGNYRIRVRTMDNAVIGDSNVFTIAAAPTPGGSIAVTSPASGASWCKGQAYNITWTKTGSVDAQVKIRLQDSGSTTNILSIADNVAGNSYSWTIPNSVGNGNYRIRVRTMDNEIIGDSAIFQIKTCDDDDSPGIDLGRLKDILRGLKEIQWWRIPGPRGPVGPGPNPCLSCPPEFDLGHLRELFEQAGLKQRIRVELFGQDGKISDLGVFGKGSSFGKSFRMNKINSRHSSLLQAGIGFKLVIKNMAGEIVHTQAINMKELQGKAMR